MAGTAAIVAETAWDDWGEAARVTDDELRRLAGMLARGSSCLGGLPIRLRADLSGALHQVELFLGACRPPAAGRGELPQR